MLTMRQALPIHFNNKLLSRIVFAAGSTLASPSTGSGWQYAGWQYSGRQYPGWRYTRWQYAGWQRV